MRSQLTYFFLFVAIFSGKVQAQEQTQSAPIPGFEQRIRNHVDSLRIIDTHEHLFTPEIIKGSYFLDFSLLFQTNAYEDLIAAGMPDSLFDPLFNEQLHPVQKWRLIEPYWKNSFNTSFNRNILTGIRRLHGTYDLNESTVEKLSERIKQAYSTDWFDSVLRDSCKIDYIIQDGYYMPGKDDYFRYAKRFESWLTVRSKYRIDSLAINQLDPIYTLDDFVKSMRVSFEESVKKGMTVVKVFIAYSRTLNVEKVEAETAKKVFRSIINGDETFLVPSKDAKPLQDYMLYQLIKMAGQYNIPVAFHTGLQSGTGNIIHNSDPTLLAGLFKAFPDVKFVMYHGSYPFGGELSTLAKTYKNVYIDMNWTYSISPSYSERYLNEWLEAVPVSKLIAFGGDCMVPESVYSELYTARRIISNVLCNKVRDGYLSESEAKTIAGMILHDNAAKLYNLD